MKNIVTQHPSRILLFALAITIGMLVLPNFAYPSISSAQSKDQAINASFYFTEPSTQLEKMKLDSGFKSDITTNNIHISGVDTWRGVRPLYILAVHYTDFNNDDTERRFVFVVRNNLGDPWFVADMPVKAPNGVSDMNRTIWFAFNVDKSLLQSNPKIRASWFTEAATSTIELGITDQKHINIAGPGSLPENEITSPALFKIEDLLIFP